MTRVFVSHSSEDNYFVDFLIELLKFHHVSVWADRSDLEAGGEFTSEIEQALTACGVMIVVISESASRSPWVIREVSHFRAVSADRPVIPLVLDAAADPDRIYEGLGLITQLRFYDSHLEGFRKLLQLLDRTLFPQVENRKVTDRRSDERRLPGDRRKNPVRRLRVAMDDYIEDTGRDLLEPMNRWREVSKLVQDLTAELSPLRSFDFADKKNGQPVLIDYGWLERRALTSWRAKSDKNAGWGAEMGRAAAENTTGAAYIIDDIIDEIANDFTVTSKDRRSGQRRGDAPRRRDEDLRAPCRPRGEGEGPAFGVGVRITGRPGGRHERGRTRGRWIVRNEWLLTGHRGGPDGARSRARGQCWRGLPSGRPLPPVPAAAALANR